MSDQQEIDEEDYYFACPAHRPTPNERTAESPSDDEQSDSGEPPSAALVRAERRRALRDAILTRVAAYTGLRFNQNHDDKGKFSSGDGGSGVEPSKPSQPSAAGKPGEAGNTGESVGSQKVTPMKPPTQKELAALPPHVADATRKLWAGATQAAFVVKTPGAGFSLDPTTMEAATGRARYFASLDGAEHAVPVDLLTERTIMGYRRSYGSAFAADPTLVLGGWHKPENSTVYLDVSKSFASRQEAVAFGIRNHQHSIYDSAADEVIPVNAHRTAAHDDEHDQHHPQGQETGAEDPRVTHDRKKFQAMIGKNTAITAPSSTTSAADADAIAQAWAAMGVSTTPPDASTSLPVQDD